MTRNTRKLLQKQVTSQPTVAGLKQVDGRDKQIADVRSGNLHDNAIKRRVIDQGAVGFDEIGIGQVGDSRIYDNGVTSAKIAAGHVGNRELAQGGVTPGKLDRDYLTPSEGDDRYSRLGHSHSASTALRNTIYEHSHSISSTTFIKQPIEVRMRMLSDRMDLEDLIEHARLPRFIRVIARNLANVLVLLMDYRTMNAFQRERAFVTPNLEEWSDTYKRIYGVDEYAEGDRENFLAYGNVRMDPYTGIAPVDAQEEEEEGS